MATVRSEKVPMSPQEKAKQDRRIARGIMQGLSVGALRRRERISESRIAEVAALFNLTVAIGKRGERAW